MIDVSFAFSPHLAVVSVQFERTAVMLVGVLFVGKHDRRASTIGLEVEVEKSVVRRVDDTKDTPVTNAIEHLNLGADAIEDSHIDLRDVLDLDDACHVSSS